MKNWTYGWNANGWLQKQQEAAFGDHFLRYAVSSNFSQCGVAVGDGIYIVMVKEGNLYLGGRILVDEITDRAGASLQLKLDSSELWTGGNEFAIAREDTLQRFSDRKVIAFETVENFLLHHSTEGLCPPKTRDGKVDGQTFRTIRQIASGEEAKLDAILA